MMAPMYSEIFTQFGSLKTDADRIALLQKYGTFNFKEFLNFAFNPRIKFDVVGIPPYKPSIMPAGLSESYLHNEVKKFYMFIPVHPKYAHKLQEHREQTILRDILQALHKDEAELLVKVIQKSLKIKNLTPALIKKSFPDMPF